MDLILQAEVTTLTIESAKLQYDLQHCELFWEKKHDTKCIMAWNNTTVVLAFRGTASLANAKADLMVRSCNGWDSRVIKV